VKVALTPLTVTAVAPVKPTVTGFTPTSGPMNSSHPDGAALQKQYRLRIGSPRAKTTVPCTFDRPLGPRWPSPGPGTGSRASSKTPSCGRYRPELYRIASSGAADGIRTLKEDHGNDASLPTASTWNRVPGDLWFQADLVPAPVPEASSFNILSIGVAGIWLGGARKTGAQANPRNKTLRASY